MGPPGGISASSGGVDPLEDEVPDEDMEGSGVPEEDAGEETGCGGDCATRLGTMERQIA